MNTASRYRLLARWASGGMADIYVARQQGMGGFDKIVALKFLRDVGDSSAFRDMFLEEVRTAALLNHPNIVQTFDADQLGDRLFLAMEFVHGETLGRFARAVIESSGRFPVELAVAICRDIASALEYAHTLTNLEGVRLELVHRDVSPSNILLSFDGMVKLLDFGIAKVATKLDATGAGVIKGKFSYMAPEQARGQPVDRRADIYSLGIVLWQLLTGKAAFDADGDAALLRQVANPLLATPSLAGAQSNEALDEIVMMALAPRIEDRYESAGDFATALSRYLTRHAAGFDTTKLIRGLMKVHFSHHKDRLAGLVKREHDYALDQVEALGNQPSIRTPLPVLAKEPAPTGTQPSDTAIEPSAPVSVMRPIAGARARRAPWAILSVIAAVAGGVAIGHSLDDDEPAPATPVVLPVIERAPVVVTHEAVAAPDPTPTKQPEPEPEPEPETKPRPSPTRPTPPPRPSRAAIATRPAPPRAGATTITKPAAGSGSGSAKLSQGSATEPVVVAPSTKSEPPPRTPPIVAPPVAPPPPRDIGSLDAVPAITRVAVNGSLTTSEVQSALERTTDSLRACYRAAAGKAQQTPVLAIRVSFVIDEARAPRGVRVAGDPIGVGPCVRDAITNIRTRSAPDVGTVSVIAQISFRPIKKKGTP